MSNVAVTLLGKIHAHVAKTHFIEWKPEFCDDNGFIEPMTSLKFVKRFERFATTAPDGRNVVGVSTDLGNVMLFEHHSSLTDLVSREMVMLNAHVTVRSMYGDVLSEDYVERILGGFTGENNVGHLLNQVYVDMWYACDGAL